MVINIFSEVIPHLRIEKSNANSIIKLIKKKFKNKKIIDRRYIVRRDNRFVYFPLKDEKKVIKRITILLGNDFPFEIVNRKGELDQNYKEKTIQEYLYKEIPNAIINLIPKSYDIIGTIAIVELYHIDDIVESKYYKKKIAEAIIEINSNVQSVYEKTSEVRGKYRIRDLKHIYGPKNTVTIHKENNCKYKFDIKDVFFSPRLLNERRRISTLNIKQGEKIVDLFAGVGSFSIQIAKNHDVQIFAFDINPKAIYYLKENIKLNNLKGKIYPLNIDVNKILKSGIKAIKLLENQVDRIIMNLPEKALDFLEISLHFLKEKSAIIHIYIFSEKPSSTSKALKEFKLIIKKYDWKVEAILEIKVVKSYSPKVDLIVIDSKISKK